MLVFEGCQKPPLTRIWVYHVLPSVTEKISTQFSSGALQQQTALMKSKHHISVGRSSKCSNNLSLTQKWLQIKGWKSVQIVWPENSLKGSHADWTPKRKNLQRRVEEMGGIGARELHGLAWQVGSRSNSWGKYIKKWDTRCLCSQDKKELIHKLVDPLSGKSTQNPPRQQIFSQW